MAQKGEDALRELMTLTGGCEWPVDATEDEEWEFIAKLGTEAADELVKPDCEHGLDAIQKVAHRHGLCPEHYTRMLEEELLAGEDLLYESYDEVEKLEAAASGG